jgi:flagellar basal body-associated protein FliL
MADKEENKESKETKDEKADQARPAGGKPGIFSWIIMLVIIAVFGGSGFVVGRIFAKSSPSPAKAAEAPQESTPKPEPAAEAEKGESKETWYFNELESIVVNPDEPGATRFVRVGVVLEMSSELKADKAKELIVSKKPLLVNWVNLYFKGLTLDQMRNDRDMKRIQSQILDAFNDILFSGSKPLIKNVLIREFNIQ